MRANQDNNGTSAQTCKLFFFNMLIHSSATKANFEGINVGQAQGMLVDRKFHVLGGQKGAVSAGECEITCALGSACSGPERNMWPSDWAVLHLRLHFTAGCLL